jgi:4-amino-4-deoxy-L-arabinose transferase-like glycosyltransferase|uniref:ArnT family glycosyltransferase n=2 Tax=Cyanobium sp. TaxID=2164130 RepID=UPI0040490420
MSNSSPAISSIKSAKNFAISGLKWLRNQPLLLLVFAVALIRLAMLGSYPLMDTTEARYGDIGRMMADQNDWITPWIRPGIPFWGKPPLSFWSTALSIKVFGVNEFATRFPSWLLGIITGVMVWDMAVRRSYREAVISISLLSGCLIFYFASGAVMTDMALTLGMVLSMWGFWFGVQPQQNEPLAIRGRWLFFVGLAWGLLAKGPLAPVLVGLSLILWLILSRQYWKSVCKFPWIPGFALTALISVPWYWAAEKKTPGFLDYFLIGEHIKRFLVPGWKGDLYGNAHIYAHGTIWLFLLYMVAPWTILIPLYLWINRKEIWLHTNPVISKIKPDEKSWRIYLICWGLMPAIFFTLASNIIMPYVLPGIPALALLGGSYLKTVNERVVDQVLATGLSIILIGSLAFVIVFPLTGYGDRKSERSLIRAFQTLKASDSKLVYLGTHPFSAGFYGKGDITDIETVSQLNNYLDKERNSFIAIPNGVSDSDLSQLKQLQMIQHFRRYSLYTQAPKLPNSSAQPQG